QTVALLRLDLLRRRANRHVRDDIAALPPFIQQPSDDAHDPPVPHDAFDADSTLAQGVGRLLGGKSRRVLGGQIRPQIRVLGGVVAVHERDVESRLHAPVALQLTVKFRRLLGLGGEHFVDALAHFIRR
ncbi:MAG: hypothetical protein Q9193_006845, partial [Seirophora villosa]